MRPFDLARTLRLVALAFVAPGGCSGAGAPSPSAPNAPSPAPAVADQPMPIVRLYDAQYSGYTSPTETVVNDRAAWASAWRQLHTDSAGDPPAVDFTRDAVVVVAVGERSSGGTQVRIDDVTASGGGVLVRYTVTEPGEGCMSTQAITAPVAAVRVPRPAGPVRFERRVTRAAC